MALLKETLHRSMRWITFEACIYEGLILLHYSILYKVVSSSMFGIIGTAIAFIYLIVYRVCGGLEEVVGSFYAQWSKNRQGFREYIVYIYLLLYAILALFLIAGFWLCPTVIIASSLYWILAITTFFECTKKSLRSLLKILFYNRALAFIEIVSMILYCCLVWIPYSMGIAIEPISVIWPLCFIAIIGNILYSIIIAHWYSILPKINNNQAISYMHIARTAAYSYINQCATIFFSSNFLVPLIAWHDGMHSAGHFKLISTTINTITKIIEKVFGSSTSAALAQVKSDSFDQTRYYFGMISGKLLHVIMALVIFSVINIRSLVPMIDRTGSVVWVIGIYLAIMLIDRVTTMYERFFIINEKPRDLFITNISCFVILLLSCNARIFSSPTMLFIAFFARALSLMIFIGRAYYQWGIYPSFAITPRYAAGILSASLVFLLASYAR